MSIGIKSNYAKSDIIKILDDMAASTNKLKVWMIWLPQQQQQQQKQGFVG